MVAAYRAHTTASPFGVDSINVTKPSGTAATDVLVAGIVMFGGTAAQIATPTGGTAWSLLDSLDEGSGGQHTKIFWKVAGASEPSNYAFTLDSGMFGFIAMVAVSGANPTTPLHASGTAGSGTTLTTPSLTPSAADDFEIRFAAGEGVGGDVTWSAPATYTLRANLGGLAMATKALSSSAATGTQNFTASDTLGLRHGFTVAVATLIPFKGRSRVVVARAAAHRAASF